MIDLAATHFAARSPKSIVIANRTLERGEKLASRFGGEAMRLADLPGRLAEFDIVVSCTASTLPHLHVIGIDCHIGSQLLDDAPLLEALDKVIELVDQLAAEEARTQGNAGCDELLYCVHVDLTFNVVTYRSVASLPAVWWVGSNYSDRGASDFYEVAGR